MIIGACVVYNNVEIFKRTLSCFNDLCDLLVVIDDGSDKCSFKERELDIGQCYKKDFCLLRIGKSEKEIIRRSILWEKICELGNDDDWIVLLDSDEIFHKKDIDRLKILMKQNQEHEGIIWIATRLYNMWSETEYRIDGYWNPKFELKRRIFKLKKGDYYPLNFDKKTIECGEVPSYVFHTSGLNTECKLLHLGYITESERIRKYDFHKQVDPDGNFHASEHIESIIKKPTLEKLK